MVPITSETVLKSFIFSSWQFKSSIRSLLKNQLYLQNNIHSSLTSRIYFSFQNDTLQVVWQYHVDEPASAAGVLPADGAVRGTRPLYLVQRDVEPRRYTSQGTNARNHGEPEPVLHVWDLFNAQVSLALYRLFCTIYGVQSNRLWGS